LLTGRESAGETGNPTTNADGWRGSYVTGKEELPVAKTDAVPEGYRVVYARWITLKNGKRIYPRSSRVFRFLVKI
jgi:hypothetical protein